MSHGRTRIRAAEYGSLCEAAKVIAQGGVVAFPTDTVYGLGADLFNPAGVDRIYGMKGRPAHAPLIAMLADGAQWPQAACSLPGAARRYMRCWWPGPLTIIAPARPEIPAGVLGGGTSIGLRVPDHAIARQLLRLAGRPLATTSANRSGSPAARTAEEVAAQLGDEVDLIIDGGPCPCGVPSTVVDCTMEPPRIVREGPITAAMLEL